MTAKPSALQLTDFQLLNLQYRFINPTDTNEIDVVMLFSQYDIDVDFAIKREDDAHFTIFTKATVNSNDAHVGYVLFAEGVSTFQLINPSALPEATVQNLRVYSGVGIALQQLRSRLADLTSFAPFGKYILPTLDMDDLLSQKRERNKQTEVQKASTNRVSTAVFNEALSKKLQQAQQDGLPYIDINAGEFHRQLGNYPGPDHRMNACVNVLKKAMQSGDETLTEPLKGAGASVTVRYQLPR